MFGQLRELSVKLQGGISREDSINAVNIRVAMSKLGEETPDQVIPVSNVHIKTKKKRKKKDLEQLRFNALKARRKRGREKSASGKLSYKNKIRSSITALKSNETPGLINENGKRMEDKTLCNRLLPEPCIGIYRNGAKSKPLAKEKSVCSFDEKKRIIPQDVMQLFNKEDPSSKSKENDSMETPNKLTQNNESAIEVVKSVKRWRWSPFTCFEELCVKICVEKFDDVPIKGFPDPLQKGQILLVDFYMEPPDYSHEIERLSTFGKNSKPSSKKVIVDTEKSRVITEEPNNGISRSERKSQLISQFQIPEKHNASQKVPDFIEFSKRNFDMENSPQTFVKYIPTMESNYCPTPSCVKDSAADKFLRNYRIQERNDGFVETPNLIERPVRDEDFLRKGKFNSVQTKHSVPEVNERNAKRNEVLYRSNSQGSKKFRSTSKQLNSSFGQVRDHKVHSRNKRNRHHNPEFDETEISNNAVLHNFQVLSFSDDQSRDMNRSTEKQIWRNSESVQPVKYFALKNECGLLNAPRPVPIYQREDGWKNSYTSGNFEQKNYRTQNSKGTEHHNKIDSFNGGMWITAEPQRNKLSKSFNEIVTNNNVGVIPPNYFDCNYQSYANNFHSIYREGDIPHPTVTFNDTSSYHYY